MLFLNFWFPLFVAAAYSLLPVKSSTFHYTFFSVFLIRSILYSIFSKDKYLIGWEETSDQFFLHYLTPALKKKMFTGNKTEVHDAELTRAGLIMKFPMGLGFKYGNVWEEFLILDKEFKDVAGTLLATLTGAFRNRAER